MLRALLSVSETLTAMLSTPPPTRWFIRVGTFQKYARIGSEGFQSRL
ncbi:MAG: hypothetical protein QXQ48_07995 [Nitrososphaerota archaeon]